ncbi:MAG: DUF3604 domain-containing protein [Candidatus Thorarchaeota archaeon]
MTDDRNITYGHSTIAPRDDVVAGSFGTWILTFTVGTHGIDDGGHIKIAWRDVSDWGRPQFQNPGDENFCLVCTSGNAELDVRFENKGHIRPWRPCLILTIFDGYLAEEDTVTIVYGDTNAGGIGSMAQTFVEDSFEFRVLVDPFGTGQYTLVPHAPVLKVIAGEPERLKVVTPSEAVVGNSTWFFIKIEDKWGNPTSKYVGTVEIHSNDPKVMLPQSYTFTPEDRGTHRFENLIFRTPGLNHITVSDVKNEKLRSISNPILIHEKQLKRTLFWGDLHGQTEETIGTGTVDQYFYFARDAAALDFVSHVGNDFQITKEHYKDTQRVVKEYHQPGKFITFLGYEWSGNTPAGGDHNVYFLKDDQPIHRSSHAQVQDKSDEETDRYPISRLLESYRGRDDVLVIPHIGGRHAVLGYHDPDLTPFIEITSVHGHFEWFARKALEQGLKVGFIGGSDDHTCRPGGAYPTSMVEAVNGGLMGVYARELTRESLWEAFQKRHVFATTGTRIILRVTCGDAIMGDEITLEEAPTIFVEVFGTTGLEKVELWRGLDVIHIHEIIQHDLTSNTIRVTWSGARVPTRRRNTDWSGEITIDKGKIISVEEYAFDLPWHGITERDKRRVRWISTTSGDFDGIILDLEAPDDAIIALNTKPVQTSFQLGQLMDPLLIDADGIEQKVEISRISGKKTPNTVKFEYTDQKLKPGLNPYYIKVLQSDGEKAWSSPIFINFMS